MTTHQALVQSLATIVVGTLFFFSLLYLLLSSRSRREARQKDEPDDGSFFKGDFLDEARASITLFGNALSEEPAVKMSEAMKEAAAVTAYRALRDDTHWGAAWMHMYLCVATDTDLAAHRGCMSEKPTSALNDAKSISSAFDVHEGTTPVVCRRPVGHSGRHALVYLKNRGKDVHVVTWENTPRDVAENECPTVDPKHLPTYYLDIEEGIRVRMREVLARVSMS